MTFFYRVLIFCLFVIIVFLPRQSFGRETYRDTISFVKEVSFSPNARGESIYTNEYLQKISEASGRLRVYTSYDVRTRISSVIVKVNEEKARVVVTLQKPRISGEFNYKDFSLQNVLKPDNFLGSILVENEVKKRLLSFPFHVRDVNRFPFVVLDTVISVHSNDQNLSLKINSLQQLYSEQHFNKFNSFIASLEDYYVAADNLQYAFRTIEQIQDYHVETLILDEFKLCDLENMIGETSNKRFFSVPAVQNNDIHNVIQGFRSISQKVKRIRNEYNLALSDIDKLYYQKGVEYFNDSIYAYAEDNLRRALIYNRFNIPVWAKLGETYLAQNDRDSALAISRHIFKDIYPSGEYLSLAIEYTSLVYEEVLQYIAGLIAVQRYPEAINELHKLREFCENPYPFDCDYRVEELVEKSKAGNYNSFVSVAQRAFDVDNLPFSEMYAKSAMEYQESHKDIIGEYKNAEVLLQKISALYYEKAMNKVAENLNEEGLYYLQNSQRLCNVYEFVNCLPMIDNYIAEFTDLIEQEKILVRLEVENFSELEELIDHQKKEIKDKRRASILEKLSHGHLKAWAGEVNEARAALQESVEAAEEVSLSNDTLIYSRLSSLKERIDKKECELAGKNISSNFFNIRRFIQYNEYIIAIENLDETISLIEQYNRCRYSFNVTDSLEFFERFRPASEYQSLQRSATRLLNNNAQHKYEVFFQRYFRAEMIWEGKELKELGVEHVSLTDFIISSSNHDLLVNGVKFFADKGEHKYAVKLLFYLKQKGSSRRNARDLQEYAAIRAAKDLKAESQGAKAGNVAESLTGGNSWFKYYERTFKRNW